MWEMASTCCGPRRCTAGWLPRLQSRRRPVGSAPAERRTCGLCRSEKHDAHTTVLVPRAVTRAHHTHVRRARAVAPTTDSRRHLASARTTHTHTHAHKERPPVASSLVPAASRRRAARSPGLPLRAASHGDPVRHVVRSVEAVRAATSSSPPHRPAVLARAAPALVPRTVHPRTSVLLLPSRAHGCADAHHPLVAVRDPAGRPAASARRSRPPLTVENAWYLF